MTPTVTGVRRAGNRVTQVRRAGTRRTPLLAALCGAVLAAGAACGNGGGPTGTGPTGPDGREHTVTAAREGRDTAEFHLDSGASVVRVRAEDLGDDLYRVSTPPDGDSYPRAAHDGDRVRLTLHDSGQQGPSEVEILLSDAVRWRIGLHGGAETRTVDLTAGAVSGIEVTAGSDRTELALPAPSGTVDVRLTDGAGSFAVEAPAGVPVRVALDAGAGVAVLGDRRESGIAAGTVFEPADWAGAQDRYDVVAAAGVGTFTHTPR